LRVLRVSARMNEDMSVQKLSHMRLSASRKT
jgi:hypothetical protein